MADVMDVAGPGDALMGRMAVLADPSGGLFGVWEPHEHIGSGIANEPVSFAWNELLSRDAQASRDFFAQVFGYEWAAMPGTPDGMEYFTAKVDGKRRARRDGRSRRVPRGGSDALADLLRRRRH